LINIEILDMLNICLSPACDLKHCPLGSHYAITGGKDIFGLVWDKFGWLLIFSGNFGLEIQELNLKPENCWKGRYRPSISYFAMKLFILSDLLIIFI
jgi:hypothetical protein